MGMGEVAATKSLTWLASDPRLRAALLANLGTRAGINLSSVERLVPESVHDDRSRPDIELFDADGDTVAVVEAKFGAHLTDGQVSAYLEVLSRRSGPHTGAAVRTRSTKQGGRGAACTRTGDHRSVRHDTSARCRSRRGAGAAT